MSLREPAHSAPRSGAHEVIKLDEVQTRFGDWGPGYVSQSDAAAFGVIVLRAGDAFANHYHEQHTETFVALEGECEIWIDRTDRLILRSGELFSCEPFVQHYLRNTSDLPFRALFIKAPGVASDKVDAEWAPAKEAE